MKNVFITGKLHTGKSAIVCKAVERLGIKPGGFLTVRDPLPDGGASVHIVDFSMPATFSPENCVALCDDNKYAPGYVAYPEVFDTEGVRLLESAENAPLIVMDELGFMETEAALFQTAVMERLDGSTPVLGVLKQADIPFLNRIRSRHDVTLIEVIPDKRESIVESVTALINECLAGD